MYEDLKMAMRCGGVLGSWCYKECKFRENNLCELSDRKTRNESADAIETLQAELNRLRDELFNAEVIIESAATLLTPTSSGTIFVDSARNLLVGYGEPLPEPPKEDTPCQD